MVQNYFNRVNLIDVLCFNTINYAQQEMRDPYLILTHLTPLDSPGLLVTVLTL